MFDGVFSASLDTDGVCISKVLALDRDGIGSVQKVVCLSPLDTGGGREEGRCQWMVSDLSEEGCLPL